MTCVIVGLLVLVTAAGCGDGGPDMADAGGIVTYNGAPLKGATVVFLPDSGPPATGTTDAEGRFTFNTHGAAGAVVGNGKVAVTAVEQLIAFTDESKMSSEDIANASRWLIPEKYGHVMTSGLTAQVEPGGSTDMTFELIGPVIKPSDKAVSPDEPQIQTAPEEA